MKQTWAQFVQHGFGQVWQDRPCGADFRPVPKGCLFLSNFLSNFFTNKFSVKFSVKFLVKFPVPKGCPFLSNVLSNFFHQ